MPSTQNASSDRLGHDSMKSFMRRLSRKEASSTEPHPQTARNEPTRRPGNTNGNPFADPPPAYTAAPQPPSHSTTPVALSPIDTTSPVAVSGPEVSSQSTIADDKYSFLRSFDTIFLIDDSGSMAGSRWREAADALATVAPICTAYDDDGIDIYFLNQPDQAIYHGVKQAATVREIFQSVKPGAGTPTGQRLQAIMAPYLQKYESQPNTTKPINIICITDGEAHDDVESPLIAAAKQLDELKAPAWQVGVQFFQIGNDPEATEMLEYLDDELVHSDRTPIRDIVDTVPYRSQQGGTTLTGDGVLKVVLGSVHRRLDRRSRDLHLPSGPGAEV